MRLGGERESRNVEDRRGMRGGRIVAGGGIGSILLVLLALLFGVDPSMLLSGGGPAGSDPQQRSGSVEGSSAGPTEDAAGRFVARVLAETEDVWNPIFRSLGRSYEEPRVVLYSGVVQSACGTAQSAVGPFYCPGDRRVYLDLEQLDQMQRTLGAEGDFAAAYVIAHEVGHHVQNLLGVLDRGEQIKLRVEERERNAVQVRIELQADCLAGLWARHAHEARNILEAGDIAEGLGAAAAVGDDRLQRRARGTVMPDAFTHGSSAQRVRWFRAGLESGRLDTCDTFSVERF